MGFMSEQEVKEEISKAAKQGDNHYSSCLKNPNSPLVKPTLKNTREEVMFYSAKNSVKNKNAKSLKYSINKVRELETGKLEDDVYSPVSLDQIEILRLVTVSGTDRSILYNSLRAACDRWYESEDCKMGLLPPLEEMVPILSSMGVIEVTENCLIFPNIYLETFRRATRISRKKIPTKLLCDYGIQIARVRDKKIYVSAEKQGNKRVNVRIVMDNVTEADELVHEHNLSAPQEKMIIDVEEVYQWVGFDANQYGAKRLEDFENFIMGWATKTKKSRESNPNLKQYLDPHTGKITTTKEYAETYNVDRKTAYRHLNKK